ncbi:uncharacterized protein [Centruroides vittatus]|uniref:uncharacterized protein n=1 Tax=Centruroides vittatus TaxID=120091 RepID=UPI00350F4352
MRKIFKMASDSNAAALLMFTNFVLYTSLYVSRRRRQRRFDRRFWIRDIFLDRERTGVQNTLIPRLRSLDREYYFDFLRMSPEKFDELLNKLGPKISKQNTRWRDSIPASDRLAVTLRYLASGETFRSLSYSFRMGRSTVGKIVKETCVCIWEELAEDFVHFPTLPEEWLNIASGFEQRWQFPHCLGAIDGKHVIIECPFNTGSLNFNYKNCFSKVLLAACDAHYRFIFVDIGSYGSESDGGIFSRSRLGQGLCQNRFNLPEPRKLSNEFELPYFFVGDEAFPLTTYLMRPYPRKRKNLIWKEKIFNYRLSRARRVIENSFGILSSRWRIYRRPLKLSEENIDNVIKATICLHNFLMTGQSKNEYCPVGLTDIED